MPEMLTASQAAEMLGVDKRTILRFARDGKLRSYRTPGGQHRFRRVDVERLASGDDARPGASLVQAKHEEVQLLKLEAERRRAKRELDRIEAEDREAAEKARSVDHERKESELWTRASREAEAEFQARARQRCENIEAHARGVCEDMPCDAPSEVKTEALRRAREALIQLGDDYWDSGAFDPDPVLTAWDAAAKVYQQWRKREERQAAERARRQEIEGLIKEAPGWLPWECRSILHPTEWEIRAKREARAAIAALPTDCSLDDVRLEAQQAVQRVAEEYRRKEAEILQRKEAARQIVEGARTQAQADEVKRHDRAARTSADARIAQSKAQSQADRLLSHVRQLIDEACREDVDLELDPWERHERSERIKKQLRPKFVEAFLRGELDEDVALELIEEAVDREI
jgi:excisionase family DNA binding protein